VTEQCSVILDLDMGIDDAIAVLYLASRPHVTITAAGSVHGNTPADLAAGNLLRVLAMPGLPDVPVALGAARPMACRLG
jgi:purine nucleosidase